jgi:hypothetical protein
MRARVSLRVDPAATEKPDVVSSVLGRRAGRSLSYVSALEPRFAIAGEEPQASTNQGAEAAAAIMLLAALLGGIHPRQECWTG